MLPFFCYFGHVFLFLRFISTTWYSFWDAAILFFFLSLDLSLMCCCFRFTFLLFLPSSDADTGQKDSLKYKVVASQCPSPDGSISVSTKKMKKYCGGFAQCILYFSFDFRYVNRLFTVVLVHLSKAPIFLSLALSLDASCRIMSTPA